MGRPPRGLAFLLERLLPGSERDDVLGDLEELYEERERRGGRLAATAWYAGQTVAHAVRVATTGSTGRGGGGMGRDLRYALRGMARRPLLSAVLVGTLALAIGANTAVYSLLDHVLLRPLPYPDAERLVAVYGGTEQEGEAGGAFSDFFPHSWPNLRDLRQEVRTLEEVWAESLWTLSLSGGAGRPERVSGVFVTGNYFRTLGLEPFRGRFFGPEEADEDGALPVAVLSHPFWEGRFGGDPSVVGRSVNVNGRSVTVVGIGPPSFTGTSVTLRADLWLPLGLFPSTVPEFGDRFRTRGMRMFLAGGKLRAGASMEDASAELRQIGRRLRDAHPDANRDRTLHLLPLEQATVDPDDRSSIVRSGSLLAGAVLVVLLIACFNVANILLAQAVKRRREMAVRVSVGAGRRQLLQQVMVETLTLFFVAGLIGVVVAGVLQEGLLRIQPPGQLTGTAPVDLSLNPRVLGFTVVATTALGFLFGLLPAVRASRTSAGLELREGHGGGRKGATLRSALVVAQVALSVVALTGSGLFLRSLWAARQIDPGFEPRGLATVSLDPGSQGYSPEDALQLYEQALARAAASPGVARAALASQLPLEPGPTFRILPEALVGSGAEGIMMRTTAVSAGYFEALGIPLLRGRGIRDTDRDGAVPVTVVNETLAQRFWPGEEALGRRLRVALTDRVYEVVGVAADAKYGALNEAPQPVAYFPLAQERPTEATLLLRAGPGGDLPMDRIRREVQAVDPGLPLFDVGPADRLIRDALWGARTGALLLGTFGGLALLLAALGIYGVMTEQVRERTREMGLRMALGAGPSAVLRTVLGGATLLLAVGIAVGMVGALLGARAVESLLYGVAPLDLPTLAAVPVLLGLIGLLAALAPALRAARIDPLVALRQE